MQLGSKEFRQITLAAVLFAAGLTGCAPSEPPSPQFHPEGTAGGGIEGQADSSDSRGEVPIDVSIGHAFEDAENLNVKVLLKAKTDLDPKTVAVSLIGLNDGAVREQDTKLLSDEFSGETFEEGTSLAVLFRLNRRNLTEYQVKVGWGADAADLAGSVLGQDGAPAGEARSSLRQPLEPQAAAETAEEIAPVSERQDSGPPLELEGLSTEQTVIGCDHPPCDRRYVVTGELVNRSSVEIQGVTLGLGLYWVENSGRLETPPDGAPMTANEEPIDLSSMVLAPGNRRKIRVTVDRPIPVVPGGEFHAHLRIAAPVN